MLTLLLLLPSPAGAVSAADLWLATDHLALGLAEDGSLGNRALDLGLVFDPDGVEGAAPQGDDALTPGRTFEAWALQADQGAWSMSAPDGDSDLVLEWDPAFDDGNLTWLRGRADAEDFAVTLTVAAPWGAPVLWTVVEIEATVDLTGLWLARSFDPDIDAALGGSTRTTNQVVEGAVVASGSIDGRAWALAADGGQGGICAWCTLPAQVLAGTAASTGDDQLGLAVEVGDLPAGGTARVVLAYGFGLDADEALAAAEEASLDDDLDADGAGWDEDCDPLDAAVGPLAQEAADNGVDDDCDGETDEAEPPDEPWEGREDWDEPVPDGEDGGSTDGGSTDGGSTDGGSTEGGSDGGSGDGGSDGSSSDGDEASGGCSHAPLGAGLLGLLLAPAILRRRSR